MNVIFFYVSLLKWGNKHLLLTVERMKHGARSLRPPSPLVRNREAQHEETWAQFLSYLYDEHFIPNVFTVCRDRVMLLQRDTRSQDELRFSERGAVWAFLSAHVRHSRLACLNRMWLEDRRIKLANNPRKISLFRRHRVKCGRTSAQRCQIRRICICPIPARCSIVTTCQQTQICL